MPRQEEHQDMSIQDHLNGDKEISVSGYAKTALVRMDRKDQFISDGYEVIKESDNSDLILMGIK